MTQALDDWLKKLAKEKIPVLKHSRDQVLAILADEGRSASECQPFILSDPGLAANLFCLMNSEREKAGRLQIATVQSLISLFGVPRLISEIKKMQTLEDLVPHEANRIAIINCIKQSWYTAHIAMHWVTEKNAHQPEEVFVAGILRCVPNIMLWTYADELMKQANHNAYCLGKDYASEINQLLNCEYDQLADALCTKWYLPEIVPFSFASKLNDFTHATAVALADRLSRIALHGWYAADLQQFLLDAAHYLGEKPDTVMKLIHQQVLLLAEQELAMDYRPIAGLMLHNSIDKVIEPDMCIASSKKETQAVAVDEVETNKPAAVKPKSEPVVQQSQKPELKSSSTGVIEKTIESATPSFNEKKIDKDITALKQRIKNSASYNDLLKFTLKSLQTSLAFKRVVFLMLTPDKNYLKVKLNLVEKGLDDKAMSGLSIDISQKNLFSHIMTKPQAFCINKDNYSKFWKAVPGIVKTTIQVRSFAAVSIYSGTKAIGMIYVDNIDDHIDADHFKAFQKISLLLNHGLASLQKK